MGGMALELDVFATTTIAMCAFFAGYAIVMRLKVLRYYSIQSRSSMDSPSLY
jgi:hypothetical protein